MAKEKTRVAAVCLVDHEKVVRSYIEMRALYEAYVKAKEVSSSIFRTGSDASWAVIRETVENHKRSELRKTYYKEVYKDLHAAVDGMRQNGVQPYAEYVGWLSDQAMMYRRQLDQLIYDEMDYARRDEKLWGIVGRLAVLTKLRSDIAMTILALIAPPGLGNTLVSAGYSGATDLVSAASSTGKVDIFCFEGTGFSVIAPAVEKVMELDSGSSKILNWPLAIKSIVQALMNAKSDWDKFA